MVSSTSLSSKVDLRAPVFTGLRKGLGVGWLRVFTLILLDSALLSVAWLLAQNFGTPLASPWSTEDNPLSLLPLVIVTIAIVAAEGLYQPGEKRRNYFSLIKILTFSHVLLLLVAFFYRPGLFVSRSTFILSWLLSIFFTCAGRTIVDLTINHLRKQGAIRHPIYLICHPEDAERAIKLLEREKCYRLIGWTDISSLNRQSCEETVENIRSLGIEKVFVCSWGCIRDRMFLAWRLRNAGIKLQILFMDLETFSRKSELSIVGGVPSIQFFPPLITGSDFWVKRFLDFCFSTLLLIVAAPIFLCIAVLIKLDSPGPIFYKQARIGLHGREFKVWKFRTMIANADKLQKQLEAHNEMKDGVLFKMKSDPRITRVGKFLRQYSLDELPQLINVFWGDMSLIGPRHLPIRDIKKMTEEHLTRHEVLPGITGLWQVSGRSEIANFEEVVRLDIFYIENWSLWLDWQIFLRTIAVVLQKTGAY